MKKREIAESDLVGIMELEQLAAERLPVAVGAPVTANELKLERREAQRQARAANSAVPASKAADALDLPTNTALRQGRMLRGGKLSRLFRDRRAIHCHKPWTDLANFTVDGRVDVCCIATGASQARFALGNLNTQSFQDVWNGQQAREFRRTVNDVNAALPPCRRCPMAGAYQGILLNPNYTCFQVWRRTQPRLFARSQFGQRLHLTAFLIFYAPVHLWLFRGFKRPERLPMTEIRRWYKDL